MRGKKQKQGKKDISNIFKSLEIKEEPFTDFPLMSFHFYSNQDGNSKV